MTREEWTEALGGVADRHVAAALRYDPDGASLREGDGKMGKRKSIKRMAVLALAAALVLALGATAYAALDGAAWFKNWFAGQTQSELTEGQIEYIDRAAVGVGQSVTAAGWTVTLDAAMTDGERVFMTLTARPEEEGTKVLGTCLRGQLASADPAVPEDLFTGGGMSQFDRTDKTLTQIMETSVNSKYLDQAIDFSYPLTLTVDYLTNGPDGEETYIEGPWVFEFTVTPGEGGEMELVTEPFTAKARFAHEYLNGEPYERGTLEPGTMIDNDDGFEIEYEDVDVTVTSLKLNPMGAVCTYVYEGEYAEGDGPESGPDIGWDLDVELADGSGQAEVVASGCGWEENQQARVTRYEFAAPIDLSEVTAVTFQGHELKIPEK